MMLKVGTTAAGNCINMFFFLNVFYCESVQADKNVARMGQGQKHRRVNKKYKALNTKLFSHGNSSMPNQQPQQKSCYYNALNVTPVLMHQSMQQVLMTIVGRS